MGEVFGRKSEGFLPQKKTLTGVVLVLGGSRRAASAGRHYYGGSAGQQHQCADAERQDAAGTRVGEGTAVVV